MVGGGEGEGGEGREGGRMRWWADFVRGGSSLVRNCRVTWPPNSSVKSYFKKNTNLSVPLTPPPLSFLFFSYQLLLFSTKCLIVERYGRF